MRRAVRARNGEARRAGATPDIFVKVILARRSEHIDNEMKTVRDHEISKYVNSYLNSKDTT